MDGGDLLHVRQHGPAEAGVVLSHRNVAEAGRHAAGHRNVHADDNANSRAAAVFDAGFSQLTTAFWWARAVLLNYSLPRDVLQAMVRERADLV